MASAGCNAFQIVLVSQTQRSLPEYTRDGTILGVTKIFSSAAGAEQLWSRPFVIPWKILCCWVYPISFLLATPYTTINQEVLKNILVVASRIPQNRLIGVFRCPRCGYLDAITFSQPVSS